MAYEPRAPAASQVVCSCTNATGNGEGMKTKTLTLGITVGKKDEARVTEIAERLVATVKARIPGAEGEVTVELVPDPAPAKE